MSKGMYIKDQRSLGPVAAQLHYYRTYSEMIRCRMHLLDTVSAAIRFLDQGTISSAIHTRVKCSTPPDVKKSSQSRCVAIGP